MIQREYGGSCETRTTFFLLFQSLTIYSSNLLHSLRECLSIKIFLNSVYLFLPGGFSMTSSTIRLISCGRAICSHFVSFAVMCFFLLHCISAWLNYASGQLLRTCGSLTIEAAISGCVWVLLNGFGTVTALSSVKPINDVLDSMLFLV